MTLSIIIVNWNVKPLLERCLSSIYRYGKGLDYEIWVVDNNSKDGSREYLQSMAGRKKDLHVILNKENRGFAKANCQATKQAKGNLILLLNPDAEILDNALQKMVKFMQEHKDCGIAGCRLIGAEKDPQPSIRNFPTVASQVMILLKLQYLFPQVRPLRNYFLYDFDYTKQAEVEQVMGAFLMTRKKVLEKVGFLDKNFFLWFEEIDFCKRVKEAGWKVIYNPDARVFHHGSQSFCQLLSLAKQRIYNESALYYFKKHFSYQNYWPLVVARPISLVLSYLSQVFPFTQKIKARRRSRFC